MHEKMIGQLVLIALILGAPKKSIRMDTLVMQRFFRSLISQFSLKAPTSCRNSKGWYWAIIALRIPLS